MNNLEWKLFFSVVKFEFRSFQFYRRLPRILFYTKVFVSNSCILDFLLYDVKQCEINNNNGGLRLQLPTLPISKSIFFQQSGWRLVLSIGATFYLKSIIFWIYNTCYLVLFCEMMGKSMSLTMQELSKCSETVCQVWAITNRLYIEICFVCLILYVHSTIFQLCGTVLPGLNQY